MQGTEARQPREHENMERERERERESERERPWAKKSLGSSAAPLTSSALPTPPRGSGCDPEADTQSQVILLPDDFRSGFAREFSYAPHIRCPGQTGERALPLRSKASPHGAAPWGPNGWSGTSAAGHGRVFAVGKGRRPTALAEQLCDAPPPPPPPAVTLTGADGEPEEC